MSKPDTWYEISDDGEFVKVYGNTWISMNDIDDKDMWKKMVAYNVLARINGKNTHGIWTDGEDFLCKTEQQADTIADFLEAVGFEYVRTGYYDPEEDKRNNEVDERTGYWYVSID